LSSAADLVAKLAAAGTPPELLAAVAEQLFAGQAAQTVIDGRKAKDRERHRVPRNSEEIHGTPGNSTNGAEIRETPSPQSPPLKSTPDPEKITPPLTPQPGESSADADPPAPLTKREILEAWHSRMVPLGFPAVAKMTGQRERQLNARLKDSTLDEWTRVFDALERSAFCRGENDRGWRADFDFLLQPKSFTKLLEGAYDH
jgi:hypothetical protein